MPENGKNRRFRTSSLTRGIIAVSTGGAALALPVIGATSAFAAPAQPVAVEKAVTSTPAAGKGIAAQKSESASYSVVLGDTLAKIAREHSVSGGWKALYEDNQKVVGGNPDLIHPGLKLTIGAKAEKSADKAESKASASSDRAEEGADRADRSERTSTSVASEGAPAAEAAPAAEPAAYTDDLDGWIKESLAVMAENGIPGSYDGIHRNIIRESGGNPQAINNWDSNAAAGIPSKGLLQVIDPTFEAYHVPGTSTDSYDPVANITAACNYAADKYGSIDNVFSAY
ncbi:transglycosylase SLT domain-containing protein [Streptomyces sp. HB132]|uniref:transglycosylase SLT domain-containing protein n=1 Tax=Streptomyces sp. HB132 TaxID=767388 RepID=UPI0019603B28|nr:transglycosylase SLT domain-containing protein [Streptomyces sp. HB132]MBM7440604.1 LysM repeat protein [Streptomyces sp. HB132]